MTVGLVLVSHSRRLAGGLAELARQLAPAEGPGSVAIEVAAGAEDGSLGTDAVAISDACRRADTGDGVVLLVDLGSAVLSAETARELLSPAGRQRVRLADAPLVEGTLAAVLEAALGGRVDDVVEAAVKARDSRKLG